MIRALIVLLAGCSADALVIAPVIESPVDDPDAAAFAAIDELVISLASDNDERDLITKRFARGEPLELPDVPFRSNLVLHLTGVRGMQNVAYGRTCAFAIAPDSVDVAPHVFFSRTQKFARTDDIPVDRSDGQAIAYGDGAVLLGGSSPDIQQFDPNTGELTLVQGVVAPRTGAASALLGLSPARIALVGGVEENNTPAATIAIVDPREGVDSVAEPSMGRVGLTATSLADGRVITIGGRVPASAPVGTITELAPAGSVAELRTVATLAFPRADHTATRLGSDVGAPVLIAGGTDGTTTVAQSELFKPLSGTLANPATFDRPMKHPRSGHRAARMPDGSVLIIGGIDAANQPVRQLERFTIDEGFVDVVDIGGREVSLDADFGIIDTTVTDLPDGRLLITGGRTAPGSEPTAIAYLLRLDPGTGTLDVLRTDPLAIARAKHTAAVLCDGTVFVSGGAVTGNAPAERYNPPADGRR